MFQENQIVDLEEKQDGLTKEDQAVMKQITDLEGNKFYENKDGSRRWVCYNGEPEASRIDPSWHGWLHGTFDSTPLNDPFVHKKWEKTHVVNLTGTDLAYAPTGSLKSLEKARGKDYDAWQPE